MAQEGSYTEEQAEGFRDYLMEHPWLARDPEAFDRTVQYWNLEPHVAQRFLKEFGEALPDAEQAFGLC